MVVGEDEHDRGGARNLARIVLARRLRARGEQIGEAIYVRVRDERFDTAGSEDAEYVAGLRAATLAGLELALAAIEGAADGGRGSGGGTGPPAAGEVPAAALEQARRAARAGVGLDTVLRRYVAGYMLLEECIVREVQRDDGLRRTTVLREALAVISGVVDRLVDAVSEAYRLELDPGAGTGSGRSGVERGRGDSRRRGGSRRERVVAAVVEVVAERGYAQASERLVAERAGVDERELRELLPGGVDEGVAVAMDWALVRVGALASRRLGEGESWQEGVRGALAAALLFMDSDPALARVCMVESVHSPAAQAHREHNVRALRALILARIEHAGVQVSALSAEIVMASLMGFVFDYMVGGSSGGGDGRGPLIELLGPLMGVAVRPFVADEAALEEQRRGDELARAIRAGDPAWAMPAGMFAAFGEGDREDEDGRTGRGGRAGGRPPILARANAQRPRECLRHLGDRPGASNGEVAAALGIAHGSHISRLLSALAREGLVVKRSEGPGKRNAWWLTEFGEEVVGGL